LNLMTVLNKKLNYFENTMANVMKLNLENERRKTDLIRNRGKENGLFRACMDKIRKSHHGQQLLRLVFIASGAFSDVKCYTELLVQFYVCTKALETLLEKYKPSFIRPKSTDETTVDYSAEDNRIHWYKFVEGYEADLQYLLGENWQSEVDSLTSDAAREYIKTLNSEGGREESLIAGVVILWAPLIIGGGASTYHRVKAVHGEKFVNVFKPIMPDVKSREVREERRNAFIKTLDSLVSENEQEKFDEIVRLCGVYMQGNYNIMVSVKRKPWWTTYVLGGIVVGLGALVGFLMRYQKKNTDTK